MSITWKTLPENTNYSISSTGIVKNIKSKKSPKFAYDKDGYVRVNILINKKLKTKFIHRLVAQLFIENPNTKLTEQDIKNMRKMIQDGHTNVSISKLYGISERQVSRIKHQKSWKHI